MKHALRRNAPVLRSRGWRTTKQVTPLNEEELTGGPKKQQKRRTNHIINQSQERTGGKQADIAMRSRHLTSRSVKRTKPAEESRREKQRPSKIFFFSGMIRTPYNGWIELLWWSTEIVYYLAWQHVRVSSCFWPFPSQVPPPLPPLSKSADKPSLTWRKERARGVAKKRALQQTHTRVRALFNRGKKKREILRTFSEPNFSG